jgi:hypothetical protein
MINLAYPRGTICAGLGLFLSLSYYLLREKARRQGRLLIQTDGLYPATDSRYWTSRPDILIGIALSALFLAIAAVADVASSDPLDWSLRMFFALLGSAAFTTLLIGCIFLWRHSVEAIRELRERPPDLFGQSTQRVEKSERYALAPLRSHLLWHSLLAVCAILLVVWVAGKLGIMPERLLDNAVVSAIYVHILWVFILTFVIVLWTTRGRFVALIRLGVLLVFSAIIVPATIFFVYWVASESAPMVVIFCAGIVAINIMFFFRLERHRYS